MKKLYFKEVELEELNSAWDTIAAVSTVVGVGGMGLVGIAVLT
ncbi:hypothetical protein [Bacillus wiedmannii]|nr:hypothetical protein [Bacillus wiedmannii]